MINAELRYYMHVPDPDSLSDEEWAMRFQELVWIREKEAEAAAKSLQRSGNPRG